MFLLKENTSIKALARSTYSNYLVTLTITQSQLNHFDFANAKVDLKVDPVHHDKNWDKSVNFSNVLEKSSTEGFCHQ